MEVLALNLVEKTLLMKWEKLAQSPLEILVKNNAQTPKFIGLEKLAVGVCQTCRSTANGRISDRWSYRSTARSTAQIQRARLSSLVDHPVGRPTVLPDVLCACRSTTRSTGPWCGRPCGRPTWPVSQLWVRNVLRDKKLSLFD